MNIASTGSRYLLGIIYFVFGLNYFVPFIPMPPPPENLAAFMGALMGTGYFLPLLKGTEVIGGVMLLTKTATPLALVVLAPVTLQIFLLHFFLTPGIENQWMGFLMVIMHVLLGVSYWKYFSPLFKRV